MPSPELGYRPDNTHHHALDAIEELLGEALDSHALTPEEVEELYYYYYHVIVEWVEEIFSDHNDGHDEEGYEVYLPELDTIKDFLHLLGIWEDAAYLHEEEGLSWGHALSELGYGPDKTHHYALEAIEELLGEAFDSHALTPEEVEELYDYYDHIITEWVEEIFSDYGEEPDPVEEPNEEEEEYVVDLHELDTFKDLLQLLGIWEDAAYLHEEEGLSWERVLAEMGYGADGFHIEVMGLIEGELDEGIDSGALTPEEVDDLYYEYDILVSEWVEEIFG